MGRRRSTGYTGRMTTPSPQNLQKAAEAALVFTPSTPIDDEALFAGRSGQLGDLIVAAGSPGRHAILFGERGVGKTSLANILLAVLSKVAAASFATARVTCESSDTFTSVFTKLFRQITVPTASRGTGFGADPKQGALRLDQALEGRDASPDDVRLLATRTGLAFIFVIDEFDRLASDQRRRVADAIKVFSDNNVRITLVLVAVAQTVEALISDHASVERALSQVRLPRMRYQELQAVIETRLPRLGLTAEPKVVASIAHLSQGLPHFVHLLGLGASTSAILRGSTHVEVKDLLAGLVQAMRHADQSLKKGYAGATYSPRVDALFTKVLCACAMAETDSEGFFNARQVLPHLQRLHGDQATIATFTKHLDEFAGAERGLVLDKQGARRKYRYRFVNPMMKTYVLIQAVAMGDVDPSDIAYVESADVFV